MELICEGGVMGPRNESADAISERLELLRIALGYHTESAFVRALGNDVSQARWNNYINGVATVPRGIAQILCNKFGVTLDWIYRGDERLLPHYLVTALDAAKDARRSPSRGRG